MAVQLPSNLQFTRDALDANGTEKQIKLDVEGLRTEGGISAEVLGGIERSAWKIVDKRATQLAIQSIRNGIRGAMGHLDLVGIEKDALLPAIVFRALAEEGVKTPESDKDLTVMENDGTRSFDFLTTRGDKVIVRHPDDYETAIERKAADQDGER